LYRRSPSSVDPGLMPLKVTKSLPIQVLRSAVCIFQCYPAHSALHTADRFREFVFSNLEFCSYSGQSTVSTDHCFCVEVCWSEVTSAVVPVNRMSWLRSSVWIYVWYPAYCEYWWLVCSDERRFNFFFS
jgi:hypothetical protein